MNGSESSHATNPPTLPATVIEMTATALECRAFGAYSTRTYVKAVTFNSWDVALIVIFLLLQAGLMIAEHIA